MICCAAVGVAVVATGTIGWRRFRRFLPHRMNAQSILTGSAAAMVMITIAGLGLEHVRHHAVDGTLAGDSTALPLCRAGSADRTDIASIEE